MTDDGTLDQVEAWAHKVVEDSRELPDDISEEELHQQQAEWYADFFARIGADPGDPALREQLLDEEGMSPELADDVLAKLRQAVAAP